VCLVESELAIAYAVNMTLLKALIALVPAGMLFLGSLVLFFRQTKLSALLQLIGAACLVVVVVTHIFEALHLLRSMGWGSEHSVGHYVDLASAVLGLTLFPAGYLLHTFSSRSL
jgi:hypothetical protein